MTRSEIQIGESTFFVQKFSVMDQLRIFGDLQKTLVPSLAKVIGFSDEKPKDATSAQLAELAQKSAANFAQGLQDLSQQLSGQELVKLADMLIKPELVTVQRDDFNNGTDKKLSKTDFDLVFDDMSELIELVIFILQLNFSSFFYEISCPSWVGARACEESVSVGKYSEQTLSEMIAWRPFLAGKVTLTELNTAGLMDMGELLKINRLLDAVDAMEAKQMEKNR